MNKFFILILLSISLTSCSTYIKQINFEKNSKVIMQLNEKDTISIQLLSDYRLKEPNDTLIFTTNSEIKQILTKNFSKLPNKQILFAYSIFPIYNNIFGFYYSNVNLEHIVSNFNITPYKSFKNGEIYVYESNGKQIVDIYKIHNNGIVRLLNVGDENFDKNLYLKREIENIYISKNYEWWID